MKKTFIDILSILACIAVLLATGCTGTSTHPQATPTPQIIYKTVLVTPTLTDIPKETDSTLSQDSKMDAAFLTYIKDNQIFEGMTTLLNSNQGEYSLDQGFNAGPKNEAVRLSGLLSKAPMPGSDKMKVYRSAMMNALAMMDGSTAGFSRYRDAMQSVIDTRNALTIGEPEFVSSNTQTTLFSGSGDDVQSFTTTGDGIRIFAMSYSGDHNFAVVLKDSKGDAIDLLANEIGSYMGKKSERLGPGKYYLDVTASGPWTIALTSE